MALLAGCPPAPVEPTAPLALFSASPLSGLAPLAVTFADESIAGSDPITLRVWDFGDGTTSTEENPVHTYTKAGKYTVSLTLASVAGVNVRTRLDYITVRAESGPRAEFSADKREGLAPLAVTFTDNSPAGTSEITSWLWDFGDGATSTEQDPKHTYTATGKYAVSLTVTSEIGEDTATKGAYITVRAKDIAYGGNAADRAFGLVATTDGRYALAGDTEAIEDDSRDAFLVITDASGNAGSEKRFGGAGDESATGIAPAGDGGFYLAGAVEPIEGGADALLLRTDASGNRVWSVALGTTADNERAAAVLATADGGALLAGDVAQEEVSGTQAWAARVDADGRTLWARAFGAGRFTGAVRSGTGFVLCGVAAGGEDARVAKIDALGQIVWDTTLGGDGAQTAAGIAELAGGGFVIAGASADTEGNSDAWAATLDADGAPGWSQTYGGAGQDRAHAVVSTEGGGIAFAGSRQSEAGALDNAYLASLTGTGAIVWEKTFGGAKADRANALVAEEDGGFTFAGSTESFGPAGVNMYLVRTDAAGVQLSFPIVQP